MDSQAVLLFPVFPCDCVSHPSDSLANGGFLEGLLVGFRALPASLPPLSVINVPVVAVIFLVGAEWDVAPRGIHSCYPSVSKIAAEACHPLLLTPESVSVS